MKSSKGTDHGPDRDDGGALEQRWPGPDCPPAGDLEGLVLGTASDEQRESLVDHLADCAGCTALVRDLRSLEGWAQRVGREHRRTDVRGRWPLAAAATLILALGGVALWRGVAEQPAASDGVRGEAAEVTPAPGARLDRPPERFDWPDRPAATGYRLRLFDGRGEAVWESDWLAESSSPAPETLGADPDRRGGAFLWTVEVRGALGASELGPYDFVLAPPAAGVGDGDR